MKISISREFKRKIRRIFVYGVGFSIFFDAVGLWYRSTRDSIEGIMVAYLFFAAGMYIYVIFLTKDTKDIKSNKQS